MSVLAGIDIHFTCCHQATKERNDAQALAERHPECRLLAFAVEYCSSHQRSSGAAADVAAARAAGGTAEQTSMARFLARLEGARGGDDCPFWFCSVGFLPTRVREGDLSRAVMRPPAEYASAAMNEVVSTEMAPVSGDSSASSLVGQLCRLCCRTDYSFLYTQHLLHAVTSQPNSGSGQAAGSAARRLAQEAYHWASTGSDTFDLAQGIAEGPRSVTSATALAGKQLLHCVDRSSRQGVGGGVQGTGSSAHSPGGGGSLHAGDIARLYDQVFSAPKGDDGRQGAGALPSVATVDAGAVGRLQDVVFIDAALSTLFSPVRHLCLHAAAQPAWSSLAHWRAGWLPDVDTRCRDTNLPPLTLPVASSFSLW
eukprot:COSAG01_NODE_1226_length_11140_cov_73.834798_12_plen_368_part_00